ncbi:PRC-barrel domain-containing protein [Methanosarcinaceae archaeon]|nr:PRC-barrel domain-containing protein [Methanosarcinaceae archaeon]MBQ3620922.1 PRC-barrel domain-containing protein [Methanosarcinaceae archaeon]
MFTELTSYFGLDIYTNTGIYVGKVVDLVIDVESQSVTGIVANRINTDVFDVSGDGIIIPYRWVLTAADIVLIRDVITKFNPKNKE